MVTASSYVYTQDMDALPGVNIKESGNPANNTTTDENGKFSIGISPTGWLEFSHVGYATKKVNVSALEGAVYMDEVAEEIPGVTITGSGKKEDKTLLYVLFGIAVLAIGYSVMKTNSEGVQPQQRSRKTKTIKA